jgi:hypothetical protein
VLVGYESKRLIDAVHETRHWPIAGSFAITEYDQLDCIHAGYELRVKDLESMVYSSKGGYLGRFVSPFQFHFCSVQDI